MKKEYMKPQVEVVKIQQSQMLCSSPQSLANEEFQLLNDENDKIVSESEVW